MSHNSIRQVPGKLYAFLYVLYLSYFSLYSSIYQVDANSTLDVGILPTCDPLSQIFNILNLQCETVPSDDGLAIMHQDMLPNHGYLNTTYDCSGTYIKEYTQVSTSSSQIPWYESSCLDCAATSQVPDNTHTICQSCDPPSVYNTTSQSCSCPDGYALIDRDASGTLLTHQTCLKCEQTGATFPNDPTKCLVCHSGTQYEYLNEPIRNEIRTLDTQASCSSTCHAGETWVELSKACLNADLYTQLTTAYPLDKLQYQYLKENFYRVAIQCQLYQSIEACNHLANLCVAQDYETSHATCAKFKQLHDAAISSVSTSNFVHSITNWVPTFPFLWFSKDQNRNTLGFNSNSDDLYFDINIPDFMTFKLYKYSLNGTFLGNETLTSQFTTLCDVDPNIASQVLLFSHNANIKCNFNVFELFPKESPRLNSNTFVKKQFNAEGIFYSLFIENPTNSKLYPIPVYVHNAVNEYGRLSLTNAQLYTRFYLYDNIIGTTREPIRELSYVKFASKFQLIFELKSSQNINVPYLRVEYTRRQYNALDSRIDRSTSLNLTTSSITNDDINYPTIEWETLYYTNHWLHHILFISFFIIFIVLGLLYSIIELFLFVKKRRNGGGLDFEVAFEGIISLCKNLSNGTFILLFLQGLFWFWFYKNQRGALVLLPYGIDILPYYISLVIAFILKSIEVILRTYTQTTNDVFFIDWEKTRGKIIENTGRSSGNAPISIWRTIYVARAWKKLSLKRQVSLEFTLLVTLLFIVGIRLIDLSSVLPNWSINFGYILDVFNIRFHPILRFAVFSMIYVLIWFVIYSFKKHFWFRFIHNPITQFIDFCSVANISVILLTEKHFGYYIHGESVHQHSDTNMKEFNQNLHMEREDAVLRRGLVPDSSKQDQVFQLYINEDFRSMYQQKLLIPIQEERIRQKNSYNLLGKVKISNAHETGATAGITIGFEPQKKKRQFEQIRLWKFLNPNWQRAPADSLYDTYTDLNEHFKSFFNSLRINQQNIYEMNLTLRLGIPPNLKHVKDTILYIDNQSAFMRGLLWNMEKTFVVFNILTFAIFDLIFIQIPNVTSVQSSFLAIFMVYILNSLLFLMRKYLSHWNTANKTLLDQRFL